MFDVEIIVQGIGVVIVFAVAQIVVVIKIQIVIHQFRDGRLAFVGGLGLEFLTAFIAAKDFVAEVDALAFDLHSTSRTNIEIHETELSS